MKFFLVFLLCPGRYCYYEPVYVIEYPTEQACKAVADTKNSNKDWGKKYYCVPEIKK
jgi:hypothetical protein